MYGRTSSRSGPYDAPGRLASRFVKLENCFGDPSNPGLTKSKIDHRSPSRFSTGVPVSATLAPAFSIFTARVCFALGFLIACASSITTSLHPTFANQGILSTEPYDVLT